MGVEVRRCVRRARTLLAVSVLYSVGCSCLDGLCFRLEADRVQTGSERDRFFTFSLILYIDSSTSICFIASVAKPPVRHVHEKRHAVIYTESHTTRAQLVCSDAENSAILVIVKMRRATGVHILLINKSTFRDGCCACIP